jgi:hypothetical protein
MAGATNNKTPGNAKEKVMCAVLLVRRVVNNICSAEDSNASDSALGDGV